MVHNIKQTNLWHHEKEPHNTLETTSMRAAPSADPEGGGQGVRTPSGKSQIKWVSIGNKQLDTPWKSWNPWKNWTPSGALKNDRLLWNWPFDFCKISWGLKKSLSELFCQTDLDPPPLMKIPGSAHLYHVCQPLIYRKECYIVIYLPFRHMQFQLILLKCMQKCPFYHHETCNETK